VLFNIPLENIEERYSAQWNEYFPKEFESLGVEFRTVEGCNTSGKIRKGQFLDVTDTLKFKAAQLQALIELIERGEVKDEDVLFFHDLWFPGLEALFYARDLLDIHFGITGILHAGTYTPHDYLTQKGCRRWGQGIERSWFNEADLIFSATHYHADLIERVQTMPRGKVVVTGLPLCMPLHVDWSYEEKENIVLFPHRLTPERRPEAFDKLAEEFERRFFWSFVKSKECYTTKEEYYRLLAKSKVVMSFSIQETWGIAIQEAVLLGCVPILPNRCSYAELFPREFLYSSDEEARERLEQVLVELSYNPKAYEGKLKAVRERIRMSSQNSIPKIVRVLRMAGYRV
jgi:hypothetical protein